MPNVARAVLERFRNSPSGQVVAMNDVELITRPLGTTACIGTDQLSVCTVIAIASPTAAIMAHITPMSPNDVGQSLDTSQPPVDLGLQNLRAQLGTLPASIAGIDPISVQLKALVPRVSLEVVDWRILPQSGITQWANELGLPTIAWHSYGPVPGDGTPEQKTAMTILWRVDDDNPAVILDSQVLASPTQSSAASSSSSQLTQSPDAESVQRLVQLLRRHLRSRYSEEQIGELITRTVSRAAAQGAPTVEALEALCAQAGLEID